MKNYFNLLSTSFFYVEDTPCILCCATFIETLQKQGGYWRVVDDENSHDTKHMLKSYVNLFGIDFRAQD